MKYRIPLAYNNFGDEEIAAVTAVMTGGSMTQGRLVEEFEEAFARYHGSKYAILVNSGSSANLIAIEAAIYCGLLQPPATYEALLPGDEVIVPGLSWPTTLKPLLNHGLQPVFCDIDLTTLNAKVETVDAVRTSKTRAVVAVPVLGNPEGLDELKSYCLNQRLLLIEDACESLGAKTSNGALAGTLGQVSAFSFYFSHHMSTIEGGAIITDVPEIADICYSLRSHGWTRHLKLGVVPFAVPERGIDPRFCFVLPGYNVRATEITAAVGLVQLRKLPESLVARRRIARSRAAAVEQFGNKLCIPGAAIADRHSWMTTPILFGDAGHKARAQGYLEGAGIETRPIIVGNILHHPLTKMFRLKDTQPALPACDEVFLRGLMIGLNPQSDSSTEEFVHNALESAARD